jgi:uncharacterized membrane protein (Fun14 family)
MEVDKIDIVSSVVGAFALGTCVAFSYEYCKKKEIKMDKNIGLVLGGAALAVAGLALYKVTKITDKLNITLDRIADQNDIEIKEEIVCAAVKQVVEEKSEKVVDDIEEALTNEYHETVDEAVTEFITNNKKTMTEALEKTLMEKIGEVDVNDIVKKVKDNLLKKLINNPNLSLNGSLKDVKDLLHDYYIWGRR